MERRKQPVPMHLVVIAFLITVSVVCYSYYNFRAKQEEAKQMEDISQMIGDTIKMGTESMKSLDRLERQFPSR